MTGTGNTASPHQLAVADGSAAGSEAQAEHRDTAKIPLHNDDGEGWRPESRRSKGKRAEAALRLSLAALERCRDLLINADAPADDLAEYDAATEAVRFNIEEVRPLPPSPKGGA